MRQKCKFAVATAVALSLVALSLSTAVAYDGDGEPTTGMMEYKLGPYLPMVDSEFGDGGPYEEFFGNRSMRYGEAALDYHLWQGFGKLSVGAHLGYGRVRATVRDDTGAELDADERASLRIIPLRASLVYRYDYSAHHHSIPLVPVLKAGLSYNFWRAKDPGGDTSQVGSTRASGGQAGWHVTTGLHLHLDFFDRRSAAAFDMTWGIANSYLFFEHTWNRVGDFGDGGIDLSANHWAIGLAFEF